MILAYGLFVSITKGVHVAALLVWCAGLLALPLMLGRHRADEAQADYARLRLLTHLSYIWLVTPAGVVAIIAGTWLIFIRGVYQPWFFAKLVAVALLVILHAWIGHVVLLMSERRGEYQPPGIGPLIVGSMAVMLCVLLLVLGKPILPDLIPAWLEHPLGRQLPFSDTPI